MRARITALGRLHVGPNSQIHRRPQWTAANRAGGGGVVAIFSGVSGCLNGLNLPIWLSRGFPSLHPSHLRTTRLQRLRTESRTRAELVSLRDLLPLRRLAPRGGTRGTPRREDSGADLRRC
jgi:hypothetical protein